MHQQEKRSLSNPVMVRLDNSMKTDLLQIAKANGLTLSDIMRLAVTRQLPGLKSGAVSLKRP